MSEESIPGEEKWCAFCGESMTALEAFDHRCFHGLATEEGVPAHFLRIERPPSFYAARRRMREEYQQHRTGGLGVFELKQAESKEQE